MAMKRVKKPKRGIEEWMREAIAVAKGINIHADPHAIVNRAVIALVDDWKNASR